MELWPPISDVSSPADADATSRSRTDIHRRRDVSTGTRMRPAIPLDRVVFDSFLTRFWLVYDSFLTRFWLVLGLFFLIISEWVQYGLPAAGQMLRPGETAPTLLITNTGRDAWTWLTGWDFVWGRAVELGSFSGGLAELEEKKNELLHRKRRTMLLLLLMLMMMQLLCWLNWTVK